MNPHLSIVQGPYFSDIQDQPRALRETLVSLSGAVFPNALSGRMNRGDFTHVVLTGMGSSFHALHPLALALAQAGHIPVMLETSELIHYAPALLTRDALVIAVSQSGRSAESLRLLELRSNGFALVGVTNTHDSPLALESDVAVLTCAGAEATVSCKTYVTALMALRWLEDRLLGRTATRMLDTFSETIPAVETYVREWASHAAFFMERLKGAKHLFLTGRGLSLAAVGTGALIIKESARFHAEGMSSAAFRHGPLEMLNEEAFVLIFEGELRTRELNDRLLVDTRATGARALACGTGAEEGALRMKIHHEATRPILEVLPTQMISLALAALGGREAGRFERASKITATE